MAATLAASRVIHRKGEKKELWIGVVGATAVLSRLSSLSIFFSFYISAYSTGRLFWGPWWSTQVRWWRRQGADSGVVFSCSCMAFLCGCPTEQDCLCKYNYSEVAKLMCKGILKCIDCSDCPRKTLGVCEVPRHDWAVHEVSQGRKCGPVKQTPDVRVADRGLTIDDGWIAN